MSTRKPRKFYEGGVTDEDVAAANESEDPIAALNARKGWTGEESVPARKQSFKEAFAEARRGGGKTFEWNGKKYTTEMAGAKPAASKAPAKAPAVTDTGDETARLAARAPAAAAAKKPAYETPYDRMNRMNREAAASRSSSRESEREALRENVRKGGMGSGRVNSKTLLPEFKKGGSVNSASRRADGIAQRGKTRGRVL